MPMRPRWPTTPPPYPSPARGGGKGGGAAYSYSRDIGRIWRIAEALEYGIVGIKEGIISIDIARSVVRRRAASAAKAPYGIDEFLEVKYPCTGVAMAWR